MALTIEKSKKYILSDFKFFWEGNSTFNVCILSKKELIDQMKLDFNNHKNIKIKTSINLKKFKMINEKIDLIKIDINGLEFQIVKSLLGQIRKDKPMLIIENNTSLNEINKILKKYNYKKYCNINSQLVPHKNQKVLDLFFIPNKN